MKEVMSSGDKIQDKMIIEKVKYNVHLFPCVASSPLAGSSLMSFYVILASGRRFISLQSPC